MKTLGIVNQKGGVGKTTTAINLAAYLAAGGRRVLLINIDPQGNASSGLGLRGVEAGLYQALGDPGQAAHLIAETAQERLSVLPATPDLAGAGVELAEQPYALRELLSVLGAQQHFDLVIINAPPSLGPLTINVLAASDALLIPLQAEYYALKGLAGLTETVERVRSALNPGLKILGVALTMFDGRTNLAQEVEQSVRAHFGELVFWSVVPRNVRLSEAPSFAKAINQFAPLSSGAAAYKRLAEEVMQRVEKNLAWDAVWTPCLAVPARSPPRASRLSRLCRRPISRARSSCRKRWPSWPRVSATRASCSRCWCGLAVSTSKIVAGERRWRAAQLAGLSEVPVIIRDLADREALKIAIVENLQREDLGPLEEARAYQTLLEQGLNQEGVAKAVGKGRSTVANALRLLSLPPEALLALENGEISAGHARAVLALPESDRLWALGEILSRHLNVRGAEALKREERGRGGPAQAGSTPIKVNPPRPWRQIELALSRRTGTRVKISGADKGRLELSYSSREELDRILEVLGYSAEE